MAGISHLKPVLECQFLPPECRHLCQARSSHTRAEVHTPRSAFLSLRALEYGSLLGTGFGTAAFQIPAAVLEGRKYSLPWLSLSTSQRLHGDGTRDGIDGVPAIAGILDLGS